MASILEKEPLPLTSYVAQTPAELQQIISKAQYKEREERYQSAHELLEALKDLRRKLEFEAELERSTAPPSWLHWARSRTALVLVFVVGFGILLAALSAVLLWPNVGKRAPSEGAKKSIAVLPIKPINAANRDEIYQIGIADSLILKLSSMKGFVVRPLSVMRKYADVGQEPLAAGREQKADYVLASNYQLGGGKIRITAQLLNVASGQIEETYKSEKDAEQLEIVTKIPEPHVRRSASRK